MFLKAISTNLGNISGTRSF